MPKRDFTEEPTVEVTPPADVVFDFTVGVEVMPAETREAYYRISHVALTRNDASLLPDGKVMTQEQVEAIIGTEIGDMRVARACCS